MRYAKFRPVPVQNSPERWAAIRYNYALHGYLMSSMGESKVHATYDFLRKEHMTPIEWSVWAETRVSGFALYPQFPAGRYFLDFADPYRCIAVECDGLAYHSTDDQLRRDGERDDWLTENGWTIYRLPGHVCNKAVLEPGIVLDCAYGEFTPQVIEAYERWLKDSSMGVIRLIRHLNGGDGEVDFLISNIGSGLVSEATALLQVKHRKKYDPAKCRKALIPSADQIAEWESDARALILEQGWFGVVSDPEDEFTGSIRFIPPGTPECLKIAEMTMAQRYRWARSGGTE